MALGDPEAVVLGCYGDDSTQDKAVIELPPATQRAHRGKGEINALHFQLGAQCTASSEEPFPVALGGCGCDAGAGVDYRVEK